MRWKLAHKKKKGYPHQIRCGLVSPTHNCYLVSLALFSTFILPALLQIRVLSCFHFTLRTVAFSKTCFSVVNLQIFNQTILCGTRITLNLGETTQLHLAPEFLLKLVLKIIILTNGLRRNKCCCSSVVILPVNSFCKSHSVIPTVKNAVKLRHKDIS